MKICGNNQMGFTLVKNGEHIRLESKTKELAREEVVKKGLVAKGHNVKCFYALTRNKHKEYRNGLRG